MSSAKIFGIGFHKTATTSLKVALETLGYRVGGGFKISAPLDEEVKQKASEALKKFDAFQDNPWFCLYKTLDQDFENCKFVLTIRPTDQWIESVVAHFGTDTTPMWEWIYGVGSPATNRETYIQRYEEHNQEVIEYFRDRPEDLLVMDITKGDGWEKLCPFLGLETPDQPFPFRNKREARALRSTRSGRLYLWLRGMAKNVVQKITKTRSK